MSHFILEDGDEAIMKVILKKIEEKMNNRKIWTTSETARERSDLTGRIDVQFRKDLERFFASSISLNSDIVKVARDHFLQAVKILNLNFGGEETRSIEILKSPIVMYYCEDLTLGNVTQNLKFNNALKIGFRYLTKIKKLAVNLWGGVALKKGKTLEKVKRDLEERFVTVIIS